MDGIRGSKDRETSDTFITHELGIPLAQCAFSIFNEVPISRQLLKAFDVRQKVVTTDALLRRIFCEEIIAHDYARPISVQDIQDLFEPF